MKILVTGNMGYVGSRLGRDLRHRFPQAELVGYDQSYFGHCLTNALALPETVFDRQIIGDVRDISGDQMAGVDAIVHLAAISNDPMGNKFEAVTADVNAAASVRLATLAAAAGVRSFVFASSCSMYGYAEGGARKETDPVNPLTAYARSKIQTERGLEALDTSAMVVTNLRFATACGMSDRLRLDLVLNDFVACAVAAREITVLSDGSPWRPLIDVEDMARAIQWAILRSPDNGGHRLSVNVGSNAWNYQVRDLAEAVAKAVPGTRVHINTNAPPDKRSYKVDFSLFESLAPGHTPRVDLATSIARLKDGLQEMGFSDAGFRSSPYMRLKTLERLMERGRLTPQLRWSHDVAAVRTAA